MFFGNANGCLECAIAATNHQHVLSAILCGVDQAVDDLGMLFARDIESARRPAAT